MHRVRVLTALILVMLLISSICPSVSFGAPDFATRSSSLIGQLNPFVLAFGPLADRAASDGNEVLAGQLEHARAIIRSELDHLKEIEDGAISAANKDVSDRIEEFLRGVQQTIPQLQSMLDEVANNVNADLKDRIAQLESIGNVIDGLPINIDPFIDKSDKNGLAAYRQDGQTTSVFITGVGLRKYGQPPSATVTRDGTKTETKADVATSSMGMLRLEIPNSLIPNGSGKTHLTLSITFVAGTKWFGWRYDYRTQTFDLNICAFPQETYQVLYSTIASGDFIARRRVNSPKINHPGDGVYVEENGEVPICASDADIDGWTADESQGNYGLTYGLEHGDGPHGAKYHYPKNQCVVITAGTRGNMWLPNVYIYQKKTMHTLKCVTPPQGDPYARCSCSDPVVQKMQLRWGQQVQLKLDLATAYGVCQGDGITSEPIPETNVSIIDSKGTVLEQDIITPGATKSLWNHSVTVSRTNAGDIVTAKLKAICGTE